MTPSPLATLTAADHEAATTPAAPHPTISPLDAPPQLLADTLLLDEAVISSVVRDERREAAGS